MALTLLHGNLVNKWSGFCIGFLFTNFILEFLFTIFNEQYGHMPDACALFYVVGIIICTKMAAIYMI